MITVAITFLDTSVKPEKKRLGKITLNPEDALKEKQSLMWLLKVTGPKILSDMVGLGSDGSG